MDSALHERFTGGSNEMILENLRALSEVHPNLWLRIPVVAGVNDDVENMAAVAALAATLPGIRRVSLLPYHDLGSEKALRLGRPRSAFAQAHAALGRNPGPSRRPLRAGGPRRDTSEGDAMNERTARLRRESLDAQPALSEERALLVTEFYRANDGKLLGARHARLVLPAPVRAQDDLARRGRAHRGRARPGAQGGAHLPRAHLSQPGGPPHPQLPGEDALPRGRGLHGGLREDGHPLLAGALHARPPLRRASPASGTRPTRRASSRSSWSSARRATRSWTARSTRGALLDFKADIAPPWPPSISSATPRPTTSASSSGPWTSPATRSILFAERHADLARGHGRPRRRPGTPGRTAQDRRGLPPRPRPCPAGLPRGPPVLLVLPPGGHHRAQRMGRLQPGPPRPAPPPLLPAGAWRRARSRRRAPGNCSRPSS